MRNLPPIEALLELEALRGTTVVVYCTNDRVPKRLTSNDVAPFARIVNGLGNPSCLDLVLHSPGGVISAARNFVLHLRENTRRLEILVPCKARSAATLICLAADEIILTPSTIFSPIDPMIFVEGHSSSKLHSKISSEDIRCFKIMAESWFGLKSEESKMHVFALLNQKFPPTTLATIFRADEYVRKIGRELIELQLPETDPDKRSRIVDQLMTGYANHHDAISFRDIMQFGLRARCASPIEERLLKRIVTGCQKYMNSVRGSGDIKTRCRAIFFDRKDGIQFMNREMSLAASSESPNDAEVSGPRSFRNSGRWKKMGMGS